MVRRPKIILSPGAAATVSAVALLLTTLAVGSARAQQENTPVVDGLHPDSLAALIATAEEGDAAAQVSLGDRYRYGLGVAEDDAEAVRWYREAAEQGDDAAQFNLGEMYYIGEGVPQDYAEAVRWYRAAAEQGHEVAQSNLGIMYDDGYGVPENDAEA
ncbi:MAG: sel1 repeat family protein, partial [Gemmatimonadales bacterium]|nr:sel1 repeat family protein [Gemmatimonadales bacterium]